MRSVIPQGLAVGAETWGIRLSGHMHSGGYNHGLVICDLQECTETQRASAVVEAVRRGMVRYGDSNVANGLWRIAGYVWTQGQHHTRTRVPSVLDSTPNHAQASLRKTARPVCRSLAGCKIGVLLAKFYGPGTQHRHVPG